jgi:hypothetical protein
MTQCFSKISDKVTQSRVLESVRIPHTVEFAKNVCR